MNTLPRRFGLVALALALAAGGSGCNYLANRGDDVLDCLDIGVTFSKKPKITLYASFLTILPIGYSNFDGQYYGTGDDHVGSMTARQHQIGLIAWGQEQWGYRDDYDPQKPDSPTPYHVGVGGILYSAGWDRERFPWGKCAVNCPKAIHLGWIGVTVNCKFGEVLDLIVGLTTLDIFGDDDHGRAPEPEPAAPAAATPPE
jgi:hypothetical protein